MWRLLSLKNVLALIFPLLLVTFVLGGCAAQEETKSNPEAEKKVFEFTLAHFQPPTHEIETILIQDWIKRIEEATDGRVKITSYPGGTLLQGPEIYEGVVSGAADIGHSCYAYTRGRFPVMEAFMVPGIAYNNAKVSDLVAMDGIKMLDPAELKDVKHFFTWSTGRGDILSKVPVRDLDNLSGVELGVTAGERADALKSLGGTGVVMPMPEHFEAISRGVTNGVVAPMETLKSFRIGEVTNYVTKTPFLYNQLLFMVMNKDKWDSLPTDIQNTIEEVNDRFYKEVVTGFYDKLNESAIKWAQDEHSIEIITLSDQEAQKWKDILRPLLEQRITKLDEKGLPGKEIVDTALELADKYNQEYGNSK